MTKTIGKFLFAACAVLCIKGGTSESLELKLLMFTLAFFAFLLACILYNWKLDENDTSARDGLLIVLGWKLFAGGGLMGLIAIIVGIVLAVTRS